ncbi:SAM-dependent methyltransferase [Thalassobacillus devorans]|uniref:SAM-dependent methyltransferase n=1 Tax=Thalassobacillus devorans TaxID=279813 RepID=UPI00048FEB70|nr:SAM-dependent methyltransferase [Thalassobacillus devorans]
MEKILKSLILNHPDASIGYDTFIDYALYHENWGYYQKEGIKVGKEGDFYTSSMIHSIFAEMFADYFLKASQSLNIPLQICEIGGGNGTFAHQVIARLKSHQADYVYHLIEKSPFHRETLKLDDSADAFFLYESIEEFTRENSFFEGLVFSNEWLDAQPVKVVEKYEGEIVEIQISLDEKDHYKEVVRPLDRELSLFINNYNFHFEEGQRIEVPLFMLQAVWGVDALLDRGLIVTVDYGYERQDWNHPARREGSLRGYKQHQLVKNVLQDPGEMDITHHVQWDIWKALGEDRGWKNIYLKNQKEFLLQSGILQELIAHNNTDPFSEESKKNRAISSLVAGNGYSEAFDICIQAKNMTRESLTRHKKDLLSD